MMKKEIAWFFNDAQAHIQDNPGCLGSDFCNGQKLNDSGSIFEKCISLIAFI